ncbi:Methyltransferase type 11 [Spirochaeta thermophila DSM 6578]|uniref:Methyltransferase type 11 n=1 Tax=Winmispira thermophila (strain ATCC 700085 / DSM 6578 / Z-1203) TaxID=869211 RepID=G0GAV5_WINT7|nr:class I SAM-dependent methyltransferase [Spirochaeta thermophila]AEJ61851.1 Methyltransferase type 11 [Spirochaeta thermophila DSM 6578]
MDFSRISGMYEKAASLQRAASDVLLDLLGIKDTENVLDVGCGTGGITKRIRGLTRGKVVGIDPSPGMIEEARKGAGGLDVSFELRGAEEMEYQEEFDVIFANSSFQWFEAPEKAIWNCHRALRKGGRIGIQAPARNVYCPNFLQAIEMVKRDDRTKRIFSGFRNPWFFLETAEEYRSFFEDCGFKVTFVELRSIVTVHTPEEVFRIFSSGAIAGYLNEAYYDIELTRDYIEHFIEIVKEAFATQVERDGMVRLRFNRIFLTAVKE